MSERKRGGGRVEAAIAIRVRGMSAQNKFFEERAQTRLVSQHGLMTQLRNLLELETEVHVTNLDTNIGGTFRVAWVNTCDRDGFHDVGLEVVETEGDLWRMYFPPIIPEEAAEIPQAWLECQRCRRKLLTAVPETEYESLRTGFRVARACERCKATTPWEFTSLNEPEFVPDEAAEVESGSAADLRAKGRARLKMQIKVIRQVYGTTVEDIRQTENVSRNGVYFLSSQSYDVGELVKVILPYKEGDLSIPVPARVMRRDELKGSFLHGIAVQMEQAK